MIKSILNTGVMLVTLGGFVYTIYATYPTKLEAVSSGYGDALPDTQGVDWSEVLPYQEVSDAGIEITFKQELKQPPLPPKTPRCKLALDGCAISALIKEALGKEA